MKEQKEKLFSDFTAPSRQEWRDKIEVDLKGADYQKKMVWRTNEGFSMEPFYRKEDVDKLPLVNALPGEFPFVRGNKKQDNQWYVRQNIVADDPKQANEKALDILNRGVNSIGFRIPGDKVSKEFVEQLLDGILLDCVEVSFRTCQHRVLELTDILLAYFEEKGYKKGALVGGIGFDPIERMLMKGKDTTMLLPQMPTLVEKLKDFPGLRCVMVHSDLLCNSGAYVYQELGYALAWGKEYLDEMVEAGVPVELAAGKIKFYMGIGGNYFMEIAKFRAARMLWAQIVKQYLAESTGKTEATEAAKMVINATTTTYNQTVFDAYVNMLRSQTEAMSAALAGIHSMVVTPFDTPYEVPTDFAERIARNQQLLLKEECHFDKIVDVSGGSYFVEELTTAIAKEGWKLFLAVEEEGGFLAAVKAGTIQQTLNDTDKTRHANAGKRKEFLLGTNQFPNFTEKFLAEHTEFAEKTETTEKKYGCQSECPVAFKKIESSRLASDFETLRLTTEKAKKVPVAFMLTIGNLAMRQARAQFSCNFLAAAGYQVIDNLGFPTVEEGVDAALKAGADIVVLCSSDDEYAEYAIPAFQYLNGRAMFVVAGAPACSEDLKAAGIEHFIHVRVDQLKTLQEYNAKLGI